jgi:hypothetical protein
MCSCSLRNLRELSVDISSVTVTRLWWIPDWRSGILTCFGYEMDREQSRPIHRTSDHPYFSTDSIQYLCSSVAWPVSAAGSSQPTQKIGFHLGQDSLPHLQVGPSYRLMQTCPASRGTSENGCVDRTVRGGQTHPLHSHNLCLAQRSEEDSRFVQVRIGSDRFLGPYQRHTGDHTRSD